VYTYHNGGTYGLFSGSVVPTKAGTWTAYAGYGSLSVPYATTITVSAGPMTSGSINANLLNVVNIVNYINISNAEDAYSNPETSATINMSTVYGDPYSIANQIVSLDSTGSGTLSVTLPLGKYQLTTNIGGAVANKNLYGISNNYGLTEILEYDFMVNNGNSITLNSNGTVSCYRVNDPCYPTPYVIPCITNAVNIVGTGDFGGTGAYDEFILTADGSVYAWGNDQGVEQLGDGYEGGLFGNSSPVNYTVFTKILSNVVDIAGWGTGAFQYIDTNNTAWIQGGGMQAGIGSFNGNLGVNVWSEAPGPAIAQYGTDPTEANFWVPTFTGYATNAWHFNSNGSNITAINGTVYAGYHAYGDFGYSDFYVPQ